MQELPNYLNTAGKITVLTSLIGVMVFAVIFLLNIGANALQQVQAQGIATTTLTVLNTPPSWTIDAQEATESSTSTPTNSGDTVSWIATATDSNSAPYFLLICSNGAAPTANAAAGPAFLGTAPPTCDPGATQWAVSASTTSGTQATAATTTLEAWAESNDWFAWVCDDDPTFPKCNATSKQGTGSTSSPFNVNHRPVFTLYSDDSGKLPGEVVTWTATSTDADVVAVADTMQLHVCSTASFTAGACDATTLATSTFGTGVQTATYTIPVPTQDQNYGAFGYLIDVHGHEATGGQQGVDSVLTVSNATPFTLGGDITLENGADIVLTVPAGETTGFSLDFLASDNNSCQNAVAGDEITGYELSVFRTDVTHNACDTSGDYDANNCYTSTVATTTWNLSCTASTTSCTGPSDLTVLYECTFPLWYIADPTSGPVPHVATTWSAAVAPVDDNNATGTMATGTAPQELLALTAFELDTAAIPYGALEPGNRTDPLVATTTIRSTGNTGIDEILSGESMCGTYTSAVTCPPSASSTIDANYQVFATSSVSYGTASSSGFILSSTTPLEIELNVKKSTSTVTQADGTTFWGIEVPSSITLAGAYTGENTFTVVTGEAAEW
jgi:hypothetical protein